MLLWSAVPWWWRREDPWAFLRPAAWRAAGAFVAASVATWLRSLVAHPVATLGSTRVATIGWARSSLGLDGEADAAATVVEPTMDAG